MTLQLMGKFHTVCKPNVDKKNLSSLQKFIVTTLRFGSIWEKSANFKISVDMLVLALESENHRI